MLFIKKIILFLFFIAWIFIIINIIILLIKIQLYELNSNLKISHLKKCKHYKVEYVNLLKQQKKTNLFLDKVKKNKCIK